MLLTEGYTAYNGHVFSAAECSRYNAIQHLIEAFERDGLEAPPELINARYKTFTSIVNPL